MAALGVVVLTAAVVLIWTSRQDDTVEPASVNTDDTSVDSSPVDSAPLTTTTLGSTTAPPTTIDPRIEEFEQCMSTLTVTVTLPCGEFPGNPPSTDAPTAPSTDAPTAPPTVDPSDVDGCNQVTTIPDCASLVTSTVADSGTQTLPTTRPESTTTPATATSSVETTVGP